MINCRIPSAAARLQLTLLSHFRILSLRTLGIEMLILKDVFIPSDSLFMVHGSSCRTVTLVDKLLLCCSLVMTVDADVLVGSPELLPGGLPNRVVVSTVGVGWMLGLLLPHGWSPLTDGTSSS